MWFGLIPFRSPLLRESRFLSFPRATKMFQFARLPPLHLWIQCTIIRESRDQRSFDSFPELFAAFHALHRLLAPRHPSHALSSLTTMISASLNIRLASTPPSHPLQHFCCRIRFEHRFRQACIQSSRNLLLHSTMHHPRRVPPGVNPRECERTGAAKF